MQNADPAERGARIGRRVALFTFIVLVVSITAIWSVQIMQAVWNAPPGPAPESCRAGVRGLKEAVRRARVAASREDQGERAALESFRTALSPEWDGRGALGILCRGDRRAEVALRELDALRYAEEHAVRYEALDLARERRRAEAAVQDFLADTR